MSFGFFMNLSEIICYLVLTSYLLVFRNTVGTSSFDAMLHNYDLFMQNPICFNYLKDFIKTIAEYEYNFVFFYIDYHFNKKQFMYNSKEENIEFACSIFSEYFCTNDGGSRISVSTYNEKTSHHSRISPYASKIQGRSSFYIEFPLDILERVEELAKNNFECSEEIPLDEVFDEAYTYVNNKLFNRYLMLFRNEEEYKKLEKIICYFDFDFENN